MPFEITEELVRFLIDQNKKQSEQISELTAQVEALTQKIAELTEKNNKNSNNSSKPPSSDGLKKDTSKKRSLREKTSKKQGGQPGHKGNRLEIEGKPDQSRSLAPSKCKLCPNWEKCQGKACPGEKRYLVDYEIKRTVTEYISLKLTCPMDNTNLKGEFPEDIKGEIQYGKNIAALLVALNTVGAVSTDRVKEIAGSILGLPISKATIIKMVSRCANKVQNFLAIIKERIINAWEAYFDETGSRVEGKTRWVHCAVTSEYTYLFYHPKRGKAAMDEMGVLPFFKGIAHHDCWKPYFRFTEMDHAVCCAHLLRELNGIIENHPDQEWASSFRRLLLNMKKTKEGSMINSENAANHCYHKRYLNQYDDILNAACEMNPVPEKIPGRRGRQNKGKIRAFIDRLIVNKAAVCLFFTNFKVDFDNNQAERDIRIVKIKTKVSGCFRSEEGIKEYLAVMSYIGTAKKHGKNAFQAILNAFKGNTSYALEY